MNETIKISAKQAKPILARTFPSYKGRKVKVELTDKVFIHDTNWGGGTKNTYAALQHDGTFRYNWSVC